MNVLKGNITIDDQYNILIFGDVLACNIETSPGCYLQYCFDFVVILERGSGRLNQECCAHDASMLHA